MNGGQRIAKVLSDRGVSCLFTLCGGHISPILVAAQTAGLSVIDVRHEANAVFAADAVARLSGTPGVAAVTAGPGATNALTAVKNAQLAQSPVVLLGGATATVLKNRGSLQDIDQLALFRPHVKWLASAKRVADLAPLLEEALHVAGEGVPGPVFLECPLDLLYDEKLVRRWYGSGSAGLGGVAGRLASMYLEIHLRRMFRDSGRFSSRRAAQYTPPPPSQRAVRRVAARLTAAKRPLLLIGSQATLEAERIERLKTAVEALRIPVYLSGMARGLLGRGHELQLRHQRRKALREADLVFLAGVPCDFRLDYGRSIRRGAELISVNRSARDLRLNRRPSIAVLSDSGRFLVRLADCVGDRQPGATDWLSALRRRDSEREREIASSAAGEARGVDPLHLFSHLDQQLGDDSVLVADGGDFVGTCSYTVTPRGPLSWLDPGTFGTLGVGAGFALGAKLVRPDAEVWIIYGDGSVAYSLAEFDTFVRHGLPVIAVVGNDASWAQIAREQVPMLGSDVGTVLRRTDYHQVAIGFGGEGLLLDDASQVDEVLQQARRLAAGGRPVLVNVMLSASDFRKGSLSM